VVPKELVDGALELDKAYIPTRYPITIHLVLLEFVTLKRRQGDFSDMPRGSSTSVRIFYPEFDLAYLLQILPERLKILEENLQLLRVVLFGSYARGNYTVGSDVDLLIVYKGETRGDAYAITKKTLSIPRLGPHLYSGEEYGKMERTIEKMSGHGILLLSK